MMWLFALAVLAGSSAQMATTTGAAVPSVIACEVEMDGRTRHYELRRRPDQPPATAWTLTLRDPARPDEIGIVLRGARPPVVTAGGVAFDYRSPHGGYIVELRAGSPGSLDVFVSHGLEVNVEPDLDPDVDLLNTDGKREARCRARE